ncbi:Cobalt transport protein [Bifidobacterium margollesii]|uniref:Cobalt transport protein n=1 Tax=Bifidobacterium margollesii TaxID=2020964 RepID=A0A2N5JCV3_9BIFI|nr:energy-coupling factor transporter transmembrane component T [Bifidobacterium margollesii]PLS32053.1 Cobalt transport protein [Bifidobacterium margollesii]
MFRSANRPRPTVRLDPRTKIALTITVGCFCLARAGSGLPTVDVIRLALACLPIILLPLSRRWIAMIGYVLLLFASAAAATLLLPAVSASAHGLWGTAMTWLVYATVAMATQMLPVAMTAYWMIATTTASELVTALDRMHVPQAVTIPLAVMFRFFPTALAEQRRISDAMRMRGVHIGGSRARSMFEYRVVPLIGSSVQIADELAQAAMTRGLGGPGRRTSIADVGLRAPDAAVMLLCVVCFTVWICAAAGIL